MKAHRKKHWKIAGLGALALLFVLLSARALTSDPDVNEDGIVNHLDLSRVGSCIGQDPSVDLPCRDADIDGDGDVDRDDFKQVGDSTGERYPTALIWGQGRWGIDHWKL